MYKVCESMPRNDKTNPRESGNADHIGVRLASLVRQRRERRPVPEVAEEIGISPSSLTRIEVGGLPNLSTFVKVCVWLKIDPAEILGISFRRCEADTGPEKNLRVSAVHLLAGQALPEAAAHDLAQLIISAHRELARRIQEGSSDDPMGL